MSKRQTILETLLGAAELGGNKMVADSIRREIVHSDRARPNDGYQRLWFAAFGSKLERRKAA